MAKKTKQEPTVISFVGPRCGEIPYFLAKLLSTCEEPILCVDISRQRILFLSLARMEGMDETYIRNITFAQDIAFNKVIANNFRYLICYHGMQIEPKWFEASKYRFIELNYDVYDLGVLKRQFDQMDHEDLNLNILFTDRYYEKVDDDKLCELAGIQKEDIKDTGEIPYSDDDKAARIAFMFNGGQKVSLLTKEMRKSLEDIYYTIVLRDKKKKFSDIVAKAQ